MKVLESELSDLCNDLLLNWLNEIQRLSWQITVFRSSETWFVCVCIYSSSTFCTYIHEYFLCTRQGLASQFVPCNRLFLMGVCIDKARFVGKSSVQRRFLLAVCYLNIIYLDSWFRLYFEKCLMDSLMMS